MNKLTVSASFTASLIAIAAGAASAQPQDREEGRDIPVKTDAIEITISGTYLQNAGELGGIMSNVQEDAGPGFGGEVSLGYRITPNLAIGVYGALSGFAEDQPNSDVATWSAGARADWHFLPSSALDPWISLGAGLKELWIGDRETLDGQLLGFDLAKLQAGVDYRIDPTFAVGPVISASATMYTHEKTSMTSGYDTVDDKDVNYTLTAGIQGRFDLFGETR